jgi:SAM-dependent methyltransferase
MSDREASSAFPSDADTLRASPLFRGWWYYAVELLPGMITDGAYPATLPMLPRLMMRRCQLEGMSCLDLGTMEGLIPTLMMRGGASRVLAVDALDHCLDKLRAVRHYHQVDFEYRTVGSMYRLAEKLGGEGFDLINCSGLLYHVLSPLMVLCGLRPLLKRNGLMIVSTNVVEVEGYRMDFNDRGRLQSEPNTFWYLSPGLLDYLLRCLKLAPVQCIYLPHESVRTTQRVVFDKPSGYAAILCRAVDGVLPEPGDDWMATSVRDGWDWNWYVDWTLAAGQAVSRIEATDASDSPATRTDIELCSAADDSPIRPLDIQRALSVQPPLGQASELSETHLLRLTDHW